MAASLKVLELLEGETGEKLRDRLRANTALFRSRMTEHGFEILPGEHPIVPIMFGDAQKAVDVAERLLGEGIYVIGFSFPVVPRGKARIRDAALGRALHRRRRAAGGGVPGGQRPVGPRQGSDGQAGAERLELGVGDDAALVQFGQFPERLSWVGRSRLAGRRAGSPGDGAVPQGRPHEPSALPSARLDAQRTTWPRCRFVP